MIISHRHQFIFIKTRKTAGTSIEVFLSQVCGPDDVVTPILPHVAPHQPRNHTGYVNHISAADVRDRVGRGVWDRYYKFCVERNPWDKTLSWYQMMNSPERGGPVGPVESYFAKNPYPVDHAAYTERGDPTRPIVDRVLRYETLNRDLGEVFARLGIPFTGDLGVRAKSETRTDRRPYQQVLSPKMAVEIARAFCWELALLGYTYPANDGTQSLRAAG